MIDLSTLSTGDRRHTRRLALSLAASAALALTATQPARASDYGAAAWGYNQFGQLGAGEPAPSALPVAVSGLGEVKSVSAGDNYGLALLDDGTVMAWGDNRFGQLGDGTTENSESPVAVSDLSDVTAISAGAHHALALLANGTVMAWGYNFHGQLGDDTIADSDVPVPVSGLGGVNAIAAGEGQSLALLSDGTVMAWGYNGYGQLGLGEDTGPSICNALPCSTTPLQVSDLSDVSAIAAGAEHDLALLHDGTVMAWGWNAYGQVGDGATEPVTLPGMVTGLSNVNAVAAGGGHSLALLSNGTVMAWGWNAYGQLGIGTKVGPDTCDYQACATAPLEVSGLSGVSAIAGGNEHSLAVLSDGTVMDWGENEFGQLGDDAFAESAVPVPVSGMAEVSGVSGGWFFNLAYGAPLPTVASLSPSVGPAAGGTSVILTGLDLADASAVNFGATSAESFTVNPSGSITAISPGGTGSVEVTVTTPAGTSAPRAAAEFAYLPIPAISVVSPRGGPAAGGRVIHIHGSGFDHASAVTFGGAGASFTVNSNTLISAVSPPGTSGLVDVAVTSAGGTSATSTGDRFKFARPTISDISPDTGPSAGGATVTIGGSGFAPGADTTSFRFGSTPATTVDCMSTTTCTVIVPAHAPGTVKLKAIVSQTRSSTRETASSAFDYTYQ